MENCEKECQCHYVLFVHVQYVQLCHKSGGNINYTVHVHVHVVESSYRIYAGKCLRCKTFANSLLLEFHELKFHELGSKALGYVTVSLTACTSSPLVCSTSSCRVDICSLIWSASPS